MTGLCPDADACVPTTLCNETAAVVAAVAADRMEDLRAAGRQLSSDFGAWQSATEETGEEFLEPYGSDEEEGLTPPHPALMEGTEGSSLSISMLPSLFVGSLLEEEEPLTPTQSMRKSHQWSNNSDSTENIGLLHASERSEAGFEGIPEVKRSSTPPKSSFSYFARMLWVELDPLHEDLQDVVVEEGDGGGDSLPSGGWECHDSSGAVVTCYHVDNDPRGIPADKVKPKPQRRKAFGIDFRCFRYLSSLTLATALLTHSVYFLPTTTLGGLTIECSKLSLWLALNLVGFAYVSGVTERRCPLLSRYGNFSEVVKLLALAPFLYVVGPAATLASRQHYSAADAFVFNYGFYTCPYLLGLNWTHFQRLPFLRGVSLSPSGLGDMAKSWKAIAIALCLGIFIVGAVVYHVLLIVRSSAGLLYAGFATFLVLSIAGVTRWLHATHELHLHHFFTCCVMIPFTTFHTPASAVCQGLLAGVYIEGVARFGMGYFIDQWNLRVLGYRSEWKFCCIPLH